VGNWKSSSSKLESKERHVVNEAIAPNSKRAPRWPFDKIKAGASLCPRIPGSSATKIEAVLGVLRRNSENNHSPTNPTMTSI